MIRYAAWGDMYIDEDEGNFVRYDEASELIAERDKAILEQQARIDLLLDAINDFEVGRSDLALQKVKSHAYDLSALEAALKAERIKTLEDAAKKFECGCLDTYFDSEYGKQLRYMANELKEQSC